MMIIVPIQFKLLVLISQLLLAALATGGYMGALPADPGTYTYSYLGSATEYVLKAQLENTVPAGSYIGTDCACNVDTYYCIKP